VGVNNIIMEYPMHSQAQNPNPEEKGIQTQAKIPIINSSWPYLVGFV